MTDLLTEAPPAPLDSVTGEVVAVALDASHRFSKATVAEIRLVADWGVEGDAHAGTSVQHVYQARRTPSAPNLRQVHLIAAELFDEVAAAGFTVAPGQLGENITTSGLRLTELPAGTVLRLGRDASLRLTGLRTPCRQIDGIARGLMKQLMGRGEDGAVVRRAGVMAVVLTGGVVRPGHAVAVDLPDAPWVPLGPV